AGNIGIFMDFIRSRNYKSIFKKQFYESVLADGLNAVKSSLFFLVICIIIIWVIRISSIYSLLIWLFYDNWRRIANNSHTINRCCYCIIIVGVSFSQSKNYQMTVIPGHSRFFIAGIIYRILTEIFN